MIEVRKTDAFARWLDNLPDIQVRTRVQAMGQVTGVYFKKRGRKLVVLLAGGDKSSQSKDIKRALRLARNLSE